MFFLRRSTAIAMVLLVILIGGIIAADLLSSPSSGVPATNIAVSPVTIAPGAILSRPTVISPTLPAGADCPVIVQSAINTAIAACEATGRNQVCYGNSHVEAEPQTGVSDFVFSAPGDIEYIERLLRLRSEPMDAVDGRWGIAYLSLQAGLPDTVPGQNVIVMIFGDVEIENAIAGAGSQYDPMQVFYLHTGLGDAPCLEAPDSGILLQAPIGMGVTQMIANEVDIEFDGTLYLQARPGGDMTIYVLSGTASITVSSTALNVAGGTFVSIPMSRDLQPSGQPVSRIFNPNQPSLLALPLWVLPGMTTIVTPTP